MPSVWATSTPTPCSQQQLTTTLIGYALGLAAGLGVDAMIVYDLETVGHTPSRVCELFDLENGLSAGDVGRMRYRVPPIRTHAHPEAATHGGSCASNPAAALELPDDGVRT